MILRMSVYVFFIFCSNPATPEIYTLSLPDSLPISQFDTRIVRRNVGNRSHHDRRHLAGLRNVGSDSGARLDRWSPCGTRSEEHTSELQSRQYLVCRLLLEKKKIQKSTIQFTNSPSS